MLSWYEAYAEEEVPPENIWEDSEGLDLWWKEVDRKRKEKAEDPESQSSGDDDPKMISNDLARELRDRA